MSTTTPPTTKPSDLLNESREFWLETGDDLLRRSIQAIEELAKQLLTVSGLLIGLYLNAIALSDLRGAQFDFWLTFAYAAPFLLLLFSLIAALVVFLPDEKQWNRRSAEGARVLFEQVVRSKLRQVRIASLSLIFGIIMLLIAGIVYLKG